jgi:RNA polymerase sigma-70 factor, ECF subfamily
LAFIGVNLRPIYIGTTMPDSFNEELVARCQAGDLPAFAQLFDQFQDRIYDLAYTILHDHTEAEDVLQDTFMRVFVKIDEFRGGARFETWLVAIAVNGCRDRIRRRQVRRFIPLAHLAPERWGQQSGRNRDPAVVVAERLEQESLWDLIEGLDQRLSLPLVLRYYYGLTCGEVAQALGLTLGTVYVQLSEGRRHLRHHLTAQANEAPAVSRPGGETC